MSIEKIKSVQEAFKHLTSNTLFVLDVDNTLIESSTAFGSFQWMAHLIREKVKGGVPFNVALDSCVVQWEKAQYLIEMIRIEDSSINWLEDLKSQGQPILGLTGRPKHLAGITLKHLKQNELYFSLLDFQFHDQLETHYEDGVIFIGHQQDKGEVLLSALDQIDHEYDRVVFVDDQKKYLDQMQKAFEKHSMDYVGMHFVGLEEKISKFDIKIANQEALELQP